MSFALVPGGSSGGVVAGGSYATLAEARAYGISTTQADDTTLTTYLDLASRIVEDYTGTTFTTATARTVTVQDVRTPLVPLPGPFTTVTSVTAYGALLAASQYTVEPWGLRLYTPGWRDSDGFPYRSQTALRSGRGPYGASVAVTATFGYAAVPIEVRQATLAVAHDQLTRASNRPTSTVDVEGNATVLPLVAVEPGVSREETSGASTFQPRTDTTGSLAADRLLQPYRSVLGMVG